MPPIDFSVTCSYRGQSIEITDFKAYVERRIAIPDDVDPSKITTGVIIEPDGETRHVPTRVELIGGKYYAIINSLTNSTYCVVWHPIEFTDAANHWAKDSINNMGSRMVIDGVGNNKYEPERNITRAEFAAIIVRSLGLKPGVGDKSFSDVASTEWYYEYILTAVKFGIIKGFEDGTFRPEDFITREQAMTMLSRAMSITGLDNALSAVEVKRLVSGFKDSASVSAYALEGVTACIDNGVVEGRTHDTIAPMEFVTRAEVAVMIERLLKKSGLI